MIETAITSMLEGASAVTTIVASRIFWSYAPQSAAAPCIVIQRVTTSGRNLAHSGAIKGADSTFQFNCLGTNALEAKTLATEVRKVFHGYKGTASGVRIFMAQAENEIDLFDENLGASVALDVRFKYAE